jgi:hypothetical protein
MTDDERARLAVEAVLADLRGRKGVGDELDSYDEEIMEDVQRSCVRKVKAAWVGVTEQ